MSEFKQAIEKYAKYVIQQSRSNLTKGRTNASKQLYNSLGYKIQGSKVRFESEEYGQYLDRGVRGKNHDYSKSRNSPFRFRGKQPPSQAFEKWIKIRGIKGRDKKTGKFITDKSLTFIIARSIQSKGIRATLFFTKPFEASFEKYSDEMTQALINDNIEL